MKSIESIKNERIKDIKKLEKKKYRDSFNQYVIEGEHLVEEALAYQKHAIDTVIVTKEGLEKYPHLVSQFDDNKGLVVTEEILLHLSTLPTPQPIMAIVNKNQSTEIDRPTEHVLILDRVQDPGNVGTMIRTADAAGFKKVIIGQGCADVYSPKVVRSMQGSQCHLTIVETDLLEEISILKHQGYQLLGTELNEQAISYKNVIPSEKMAIVMGNEGHGVSRDVLNETHSNVYIPIKGQAESLNVAIAAGILMFMFS
ncbi:MAG: TrmH family RNA methyltransferase [Vagococcus sp.]